MNNQERGLEEFHCPECGEKAIELERNVIEFRDGFQVKKLQGRNVTFHPCGHVVSISDLPIS
jgi:hypothetical protein